MELPLMALGELRLNSTILKRQVSLSFCLPNRQQQAPRTYPALLQLHGAGGDHTSWVALSKLAVYAEPLPLIVIVPDGSGAYNGWSDWKIPHEPFESFIMQDLVPACQHFFAIEPGHWAIGGNSMGGYGAMYLGLKHPHIFRSIYAHSSVVYTPERIQAMRPDLSAHERAAADLRHLAERAANLSSRPALGFDCGSEDTLVSLNRDFHAGLEKIGYPHQYTELPGDHSWQYWDKRLPVALQQHIAVLTGSDLDTPELAPTE